MKLQALFLCALFVSSCTQQSAPKNHINKPPNIIIVLTDDQGFKDVGFNGSQDILTPTLISLQNKVLCFQMGMCHIRIAALQERAL